MALVVSSAVAFVFEAGPMKAFVEPLHAAATSVVSSLAARPTTSSAVHAQPPPASDPWQWRNPGPQIAGGLGLPK